MFTITNFLLFNFPTQRFPFDRRKPIGYFAAVTLQFIMSTYGFALVANMSCIGVGCYHYALSFNNDLKSILQSIDENSKNRKQRPKITTELTEFIRMHSIVKKLSEHFTQ